MEYRISNNFNNKNPANRNVLSIDKNAILFGILLDICDDSGKLIGTICHFERLFHSFTNANEYNSRFRMSCECNNLIN